MHAVAPKRIGVSRRASALPLGAALVAGLFGAANAASAEEQTLAPVTVKAAAEQQDGYRATQTRVGKVVQDPQDVPQAITTITRSLMEEQDANTLREALRNVSGLSFNAAEGGRSGDNMMLRGFYTFGDIYLDGIRDTAQYNREVFNLEQVDVLRGAASMLFGRGQAGGVINQVSKTPMLYGINKAGVAIGGYGYLEARGDLNQRLGETSAFRINVMAREEGSDRSNPVNGASPEIKRAGVAPSISFGLGTPHEVTLSYYYLATRDLPDYGVPFDATTRRPNHAYAKSGAFWGTDRNFDDSDTNIATLNYLFRISPDTQLRTVIRGANYKRSYWAVAPQSGAPTAYSLASQAKTREFDTDNFVFESDFSTAFTLFGMKNEFLAGVEYLKEDSTRWNLRNLGTATRPFFTPGQHVTGPANTYNGDTYSAYVQDTLEFVSDWRLTAGLRRDEMRSDYQTVAGATVSRFSGDFGENSYRTGLSWQPSAAQHYYLSWSDSFSPTADLYQLSGSQYPAERSNVTELGAKWLLLDGNLAFRTAIYHAVKEWERNTDLESTAAILTKKRRTDGLELEVAGRVTPKWEVFSGFSLMDAEILEVAPGADVRLEGQRPRNTPKLTFNLWSTYALGGGWKIGGGVEAKSDRYAYVPTAANANSNFVNGKFSPNTAPGYARWDAMLAYEQKSWAARLNVKNIFDRVYYDAVYDQGGFAIPGSGRAIILTGEYKF